MISIYDDKIARDTSLAAFGIRHSRWVLMDNVHVFGSAWKTQPLHRDSVPTTKVRQAVFRHRFFACTVRSCDTAAVIGRAMEAWGSR